MFVAISPASFFKSLATLYLIALGRLHVLLICDDHSPRSFVRAFVSPHICSSSHVKVRPLDVNSSSVRRLKAAVLPCRLMICVKMKKEAYSGFPKKLSCVSTWQDFSMDSVYPSFYFLHDRVNSSCSRCSRFCQLPCNAC